MPYVLAACPHCGRNMQCDDKHLGKSVKCPACLGVLVVSEPAPAPAQLGSTKGAAPENYRPPQSTAAPNHALPQASRVNYAAEAEGWKPVRTDYLAEAQAWEAERETQAHATTDTGAHPFAAVCQILGMLAFAFGLVDFVGEFLNYDITGVFWSPIAASVVGSGLFALAQNLNQGRPGVNAVVTTLSGGMIALLAVAATIRFAQEGRVVIRQSVLEAQVREAILQKWSTDADLAKLKITGLSLNHVRGNSYRGSLTATAAGESVTLVLMVTNTAKTLWWKFEQDPSIPSPADTQAGAPRRTDRHRDAMLAFRVEGCSLGMTFPQVRARFPNMQLSTKESRVQAKSATWEIRGGLAEHDFARLRFFNGDLYSMVFLTSYPDSGKQRDYTGHANLAARLGPPDEAEDRNYTWLFAEEDRRVRLAQRAVNGELMVGLFIDKPSTVLVTGGAGDEFKDE